MKAFKNLLFVSIGAGISLTHAQAKDFQIQGMKHTPTKVVLPLQVNDDGFASSLYSIIQEINRADGLSGKTGPRAEISLLGWLSDQNQFLMDLQNPDKNIRFTSDEAAEKIKGEIRKKVGLNSSQPVPLLEIAKGSGMSTFAFFQDLFEPLLSTQSGQQLTLLELSTDQELGDNRPIFSALAGSLNAKVIAAEKLGGDDDGGNLEVTPDGKPYVGSTTTPALRARIKKLTGQDPLVLPTEWLYVGHVDEMLTFLPTQDTCGSMLVYADPLEAINFMREFGKVPLIPREDLEGMGATIRNPEEYHKRFFNSLNYFMKSASKEKRRLELSDFDIKKPVRDLTVNRDQMDIEFLGNLNAFQQIQEAVGILQGSLSSVCQKNLTKIPTLFSNRKGVSFELANAESEIKTGYIAVAGYINLISLRNHVIISRETTAGHYLTEDEELVPVKKSDAGFFGPIVRKRYSKILGGDQFVHEIKMDYYERGSGSAHCTTNVIRSSEVWK